MHADATVALLGELRVELLGVRSRRLHEALVSDAVEGRIDGRIAQESGCVAGVVLAAPARYWRTLPARRWGLALEVLGARLRRRGIAAARAHGSTRELGHPVRTDAPPRTWSAPGDAWRIIFVGTGAASRGRGVAAALYRDLMADRSLVARIALDNGPSLRLHQATGWQLHRDGGVALAVHLRPLDA